jgi:hypothetical protein
MKKPECDEPVVSSTSSLSSPSAAEDSAEEDGLTHVLRQGQPQALAAIRQHLGEVRKDHIALALRAGFVDFVKTAYANSKQSEEDAKELLEQACIHASDTDLREILHWDLKFVNPISSLIAHNRMSLTQDLISSKELYASSAEFRSLLKAKQVSAAKQSVNVCKSSCPNKTYRLLQDAENIRELIRLIRDPEIVLEATSLLRSVKTSHLNELHLQEVKEVLRDILDSAEDSMLVRHWNPILVCVVLAELCDSLKPANCELCWEFDELSEELCGLANDLMTKTKDICQMQAILLDNSYNRLHLIDILARNSTKYRALLRHPYVAIIINRLWVGDSAMEFALQKCSYVFSMLKRRSPSKIWSVRPLTPEGSSIFQFNAWKYNATIRQLLEGLLLFVLFIHSLYMTSIYIKAAKVDANHLGHSAQEIQSAKDDMDSVKSAIDIYLLFLLLLALNLGFKFLYKFFLKEEVFPDPRVVTDLVLTVCALCFKLEVFGSVDTYTSNYEYVWAVMFSVILIRASLVLTITRQYGPILRMIQIVIIDVSKYLSVYFISICVFAVAANLLFFREGEEYETFSRSMITMFESSLGGFDFTVFAWRKYTGWVFLTVWIFFSAVILLNLLIAVLSSRYDEINPQANADYASLLYTYYSFSRYTHTYGALVIFTVPWNALLVPFVPLFFFKRTAAKANFYLAHVSYLLLLVFTFVLFTILNLVLIPYVYIKKLRQLVTAKDLPQKSRVVASWVFLGLGFLCLQGALSYKVLFKFLYDRKQKGRRDMSPLQNVIQEQLEGLCSNSTMIAPVEELSSLFHSDVTHFNLFSRGVSQHSEGVFSEILESLDTKAKMNLLLKFRSSPCTVDLAFALRCVKQWSWQQLVAADPFLVKTVLGVRPS